jgi:hypothetical protein
MIDGAGSTAPFDPAELCWPVLLPIELPKLLTRELFRPNLKIFDGTRLIHRNEV